MSQALVHARPNFAQVTKYCIDPVFGLLPAVALTFGFLSPKSNHHIQEPKYICDQNLAKFS